MTREEKDREAREKKFHAPTSEPITDGTFTMCGRQIRFMHNPQIAPLGSDGANCARCVRALAKRAR